MNASIAVNTHANTLCDTAMTFYKEKELIGTGAALQVHKPQNSADGLQAKTTIADQHKAIDDLASDEIALDDLSLPELTEECLFDDKLSLDRDDIDRLLDSNLDDLLQFKPLLPDLDTLESPPADNERKRKLSETISPSPVPTLESNNEEVQFVAAIKSIVADSPRPVKPRKVGKVPRSVKSKKTVKGAEAKRRNKVDRPVPLVTAAAHGHHALEHSNENPAKRARTAQTVSPASTVRSVQPSQALTPTQPERQYHFFQTATTAPSVHHAQHPQNGADRPPVYPMCHVPAQTAQIQHWNMPNDNTADNADLLSTLDPIDVLLMDPVAFSFLGGVNNDDIDNDCETDQNRHIVFEWSEEMGEWEIDLAQSHQVEFDALSTITYTAEEMYCFAASGMTLHRHFIMPLLSRDGKRYVPAFLAQDANQIHGMPVHYYIVGDPSSEAVSCPEVLVHEYLNRFIRNGHKEFRFCLETAPGCVQLCESPEELRLRMQYVVETYAVSSPEAS
jgi:hypothetical protein